MSDELRSWAYSSYDKKSVLIKTLRYAFFFKFLSVWPFPSHYK
jgi:hypothetical protein